MWMSRLKQLLSHPAFARLRDLLVFALDYGTGGYPPEVRRRLKIMNVVSYLIVFFTVLYLFQHLSTDYNLWKVVIWVNIALIFIAAAVPFLHRYGEITGGMTIAIAELIAQFILMAELGRSSGMHIQYIALAAAPFVILGLERLKLVALIVISALALHIITWFIFPGKVDLVATSSDKLNALYINAAVTTFAIISATVYYAFRLAEQAKAETDNLLRNILPESVVDRLKESPGETIADSVDSATVLFSDLKGFVPTSKALGPQRTVALLNDLMKSFDAEAARCGVEKIKTIGDAYMAASGVPEPVEDHACRMCHLAFGMLQAAEEVALRYDTSLVMRIGIASGPLMAGVIGTKRQTYDVWGDTVNFAARLESTSLPGRIQVSQSVREAVDGSFASEGRQGVEIKGIGSVDTWLLTRPLDRSGGGPCGSIGQQDAALAE